MNKGFPALTYLSGLDSGWLASVHPSPPMPRWAAALPFVIPRGCDFFNFLWPESCEEHLPISIAGVLRLRAVSPVLSDRSARRFAQDDDSVVGIKNIGSSSKHE